MARETVELVTCDICGERLASPFVLVRSPRQGLSPGKLTDLCETHAAPLTEILEKGRSITVTVDTAIPARSQPRRAARAVRPARRIYTEEELDALERAETSELG